VTATPAAELLPDDPVGMRLLILRNGVVSALA